MILYLKKILLHNIIIKMFKCMFFINTHISYCYQEILNTQIKIDNVIKCLFYKKYLSRFIIMLNL